MELWKDLQTNRYYFIDEKTGLQTQCDRYGQPPTYFKPYQTGFPTARETHSSPLPSQYTIQPKKFDGYFQCPRPVSIPFFNDLHGYKTLKPSKPGKMMSNRLPDDITKIPRPLAHLTISGVYDKTIKSPKQRLSATAGKIVLDQNYHTISELKSSLIKPEGSLIRNLKEMTAKMEKEKKNLSVYKVPETKVKRKKLKGYFMLNYKTSNDLWVRDKQILELSNPAATFKTKNYEEVDRKNLEKRRAQRILKNRASVN